MALIKTQLKNSIKSLLEDMRSREEVSDDEFAERLASTIHDYITSATITVSGVVTVGNATTQTQTAAVNATIT